MRATVPPGRRSPVGVASIPPEGTARALFGGFPGLGRSTVDSQGRLVVSGGLLGFPGDITQAAEVDQSPRLFLRRGRK